MTSRCWEGERFKIDMSETLRIIWKIWVASATQPTFFRNSVYHIDLSLEKRPYVLMKLLSLIHNKT